MIAIHYRKNRIETTSRHAQNPAMVTHHFCTFETARGICGIAWSEAGISRFHLPARDVDTVARGLRRRQPDAEPAQPTGVAAEAVAAATRYFAGEKIDFSDFVLDLEGQDDARRQIYNAARGVGWGETVTYGELAKRLGRNDWEAARDVGQAMARNPVALIIPCHRVLAAGNKVGGFSAPGGSATKLAMLRLEGVSLGGSQQGTLALDP
jgi:methylated-DNA-[protein]-cysteine S-methyltransferase